MIHWKDFVGLCCWWVIINENNEVLLIRKRWREFWETPWGKLEVGETLIECLKREIQEEANIKISWIHLLRMEEMFTSSWGHWISFNYFAHYESGEVKLNEEEKHEEIAWFTLDKLPQMSPYGKKAIEEYERKYFWIE